MSLGSKIRDLPEWLILVLALAAAIGIGITDYLVGWETSLFFFYAAPIFVVGYRLGRGMAVIFSLLSAGIWWFGNRESHPYRAEGAFMWVTITRGVYMVAVAYAANLLKRLRDAEKERSEALAREAELRRDMLREIEEQQRHFGRELHDGLCQLLSGTTFAISTLVGRLGRKPTDDAAALREIESFVRKGLMEGQALARGLFPVQMGSEGLPAAIAELVAMTGQMVEGTRVTFAQSGPTPDVDSETAMHIYRIAQEGLANAVKHSEAKNISVTLSTANGSTMVEVTDDGVGMSPNQIARKGIGLRTMSYRAGQIGASLEILANEPRGTRVICLLSIAAGASKPATRPKQ